MNNNLLLKKIINLFQSNNLNEALILCDQNYNDTSEHIVKNLKGAIYFKQKNFNLAKKNFLKSIELNKNFIDPFKNLYSLFITTKDYENLIIIAKKILELDKKNSSSHFKLAYALEMNGNLTQSINFYNSAISLDFNDKKMIYNNLGNIYLTLDKTDKSIEFFSLALEKDQNNKIIFNNLVNAQIKTRNIDKIEKLLNQAKVLDENYNEYLHNKAQLLILKKQFEKAIIILKDLIKNYKDSKYSLLLAKIYFTTGDKVKGNNLINETVISFPKDLSVINFKGMRDLSDGNFENGWKFYESRRTALNKMYPEIPEWNGETLIDKKILVYNEQGIGDCIQFSKYLFPLKKICKNIDFLVDKKICEMFSKDIIGINICTKNEITLSAYDFKIPLASLLKFFYKDINKFNESLIYIDPVKSNNYKKEIDTSKINIGLVWSGSFYGPKEPYSSIPLSKMNNILNLNANFYCLQNEIRFDDKSTFEKSNIINYGHLSFGDIPSFAHNLDLIISTDTSFIHMSGSIKKETWGLIPIDPDWRWGKFYDLDPYFNSKIYKQKNFDNWDETLNTLQYDLKKKIEFFNSKTKMTNN